MKVKILVLLPIALGTVLLGAEMRAHTTPTPSPVVKQAEVPVTTSLGTVDVTGQAQGLFGGNADVLSFEYEVVSPRDPATGLPTGKRLHKPVTFTRRIDDASPQYFQAITTNENLSKVVFRFVKTDATGKANFYIVTLFNASISDFHQNTMKTENNASTDKMETEQISLTFQKIEVRTVNKTASDNWNLGA